MAMLLCSPPPPTPRCSGSSRRLKKAGNNTRPIPLTRMSEVVRKGVDLLLSEYEARGSLGVDVVGEAGLGYWPQNVNTKDIISATPPHRGVQ